MESVCLLTRQAKPMRARCSTVESMLTFEGIAFCPNPRRRLTAFFLACVAVAGSLATAQTRTVTDPDQRVILVMSDGLRWQEVFRGADATLLTPKNYYDDRSVTDLQHKYLADTPEQRREKLMPFVWSTLVPQGQIFGDRDAASDAQVTNGFNFSYPGYSEVLTGHGDPRINSNDDKPNPNLTVLAWLSHQPGLESQVAVFGAWQVIANIVNRTNCDCTINVSYDPLTMSPSAPRIDLLNQIKQDAPRIWDDEAFDAPVFYTAMEYIRARHPHIVFLSLGETDDWAHAGNYGEYLESAHRADDYMRQLWDALQSMPDYRGKTTIIFLPDHGRGSGPEDWKSHGQKIPDSKNVFLGAMGPGVTAKGLRTNAPAITSSQVAATLAAISGRNWNAAEPNAGRPIAELLSPAQQAIAH